MAIMNRLGSFLYNVCMFLSIGIFFLALKNFNLQEPNETLDYDNNLKIILFGLVLAYYAFAIVLSLASLISKARKKRVIFTFAMLWLWAMMGLNVLFVFVPGILQEEYTTSGWRYSMLMITIGLAFIPSITLIFHQFPGSIDKNYLIKQVKDKLKKEQVKTKSYCPECKYPSEEEWKHCPKCGVHFSD